MNIQSYLSNEPFQLGAPGLSPSDWQNPDKPFQSGEADFRSANPGTNSSNKVNQRNNFHVIHSFNARPFNEKDVFCKDWHMQLFRQLVFCFVSKQDRSDRRFALVQQAKKKFPRHGDPKQNGRVFSQHGSPVSMVHLAGMNYLILKMCDELREQKGRDATYIDILQYVRILGIGINPPYVTQAYPDGVHVNNVKLAGIQEIQNYWANLHPQPDDQLYIILKPYESEVGQRVKFCFNPEKPVGYPSTEYVFKNKCVYFMLEPYCSRDDPPDWEMFTLDRASPSSGSSSSSPPTVTATSPPSPTSATGSLVTSNKGKMEGGSGHRTKNSKRATKAQVNSILRSPVASRERVLDKLYASPDHELDLVLDWLVAYEWFDVDTYVTLQAEMKSFLSDIKYPFVVDTEMDKVYSFIEGRADKDVFSAVFWLMVLVAFDFPKAKALAITLRAIYPLIYTTGPVSISLEEALNNLYDVAKVPNLTNRMLFASDVVNIIADTADASSISGFLSAALRDDNDRFFNDSVDTVVGYWWRIGRVREIVNVGGTPHQNLLPMGQEDFSTDYAASVRAKAIEIFMDTGSAMNLPL